MKRGTPVRFDAALLVAFILSLCAWVYVGLYHTLYSIGLYLIVPVLVAGAVVAGLSFLFPRRTSIRALRLGLGTSTLLYFLLIISEVIGHYEPTYEIHVPADYEGRVLVFFQEDKTEDVAVDEHGIAYIQRSGGFELDLYHGEREITEAFNSSRTHSLIWYNADSSWVKSIDLWCFDVEIGKEYPMSEQPFKIDSCLTEQEFDSMVLRNMIDTSRIVIHHYSP